MMKKRMILPLLIYFVCALLFFMSIPKELYHCESAFKNIYWMIFYFILYFFTIKKTPEITLMINRYQNKDCFLLRRMIQLGIDDFIFCFVTYLINIVVLALCGLNFSVINLFQFSFHLFFLLLNFSFFNLLMEILSLNKIKGITILIFLIFCLMSNILSDIDKLRYFLLTAGYAMAPEISLTYSVVLYLSYLIFWYLLYQIISLKRKDI